MVSYAHRTAFSVIAFALLVTNSARAAGGAYAVDDAAVDSIGSCKAEAWFSTSDHSPANRAAVISPSCTIGILNHRLETSATFSRMRTSGEYGSSITIKGKTPVPGFDFNANNTFGIAVTASASYNLTSDRYGAVSVALPFSIRISEPLVLLANFGHSHDQFSNTSSTNWGAAFEFNLKPLGFEKLTLIGETFGNDRERDPRAQLGLRFTPASKIDLDLIYGHRLTGQADNWLTAGMTLRF